MLTYPEISPVIVAIGPLQVRWYGMMYLLGFLSSYLLVRYQAVRFDWRELTDRVDNLNFWLILGVIFGGRLGYVCLYNPGYYLEHPLEILATWQGGMSFHGGCVGALVAGVLYCWLTDLAFFKAADLYVATVPVGLFFGRIGNFINGELFGRVSEVPWAMVFPLGGPQPRHPSQLYEALLEGVILFILLWSLKGKPWQKRSTLWPHGTILATFLFLYGGMRFFVELFREPDAHLGTLAFGLTMGQWLSLTMICAGPLLWRVLQQKK
ncbi:MAG: prolipoprotein diacylglyceryl transferase [Desulfobulbus propionicus]|nr:MAG: prolipoprotein diacylglyceryl transferase [Desulfobulbus propionicus]